MLQNRDVGQLLVILAIAEQGSLNRAAKALYTSQPALTRALQEFETMVGGRVFERSASGVRPTDLGEAIIAHARAIRSEVQGTIRDIDAIRAGGRREMSVGLTPYHPLPLLAPALDELVRTHPELELRLRYGSPGDLRRWLEEGSIEVAVGPLVSGPDAQRYVQQVLFFDELGFYCRRSHRLAQVGRIGLDDLQDADWVLGPPRSFVRTRVESLFESAGREPPPVRLEVDDVATRRALVTYGHYLSAFQRSQVQRELDSETLVPIEYDWPQAHRPFGTIRVTPPTEDSLLLAATLRRHYAAGGLRMAPEPTDETPRP